jgi:hypothetical protein
MYYYVIGNYDQSVDTYFKALRLSTNKDDNFKTFLRVGEIFFK